MPKPFLRAELFFAALACSVLTCFAVETGFSQSCAEINSEALSSAIGCVRAEQIESLRALRTAGPASGDREKGLELVGELASCLRNARLTGRESWLPQLLCLLQDVLGFVDTLPDGEIRAEDRLWRSELSMRFLLLPRSLPLDPPWNWEKLIDRTLAETVEVYRTATEVLRHPDDYFTASAARRLGLDFRNPAPRDLFLEQFLELSLTAATKYPRKLGPPVAAALDPLLCSAMELYPGRKEHWESVHFMLIGFDAGNLSGTVYLQEFSRRLQAVFDLPPPKWQAAMPPCGEQEVEGLMFPRFDLPPQRITLIPPDLERTLRELERLLSLATQSMEDRGRSFSPWQSYGRFLSRLAKPLQRPSRGSRDAQRLSDQLFKAAADGLKKGIESSGTNASPEDLAGIRDDLIRLLEDYAKEMLRNRRYGASADFLSGFATVEGLLNEAQTQSLHSLTATAYYLAGDVTSAALHASLAPITMAELGNLERQLQVLGIGVIGK